MHHVSLEVACCQCIPFIHTQFDASLFLSDRAIMEL
jgi:hypothetical protein